VWRRRTARQSDAPAVALVSAPGGLYHGCRPLSMLLPRREQRRYSRVRCVRLPAPPLRRGKGAEGARSGPACSARCAPGRVRQGQPRCNGSTPSGFVPRTHRPLPRQRIGRGHQQSTTVRELMMGACGLPPHIAQPRPKGGREVILWGREANHPTLRRRLLSHYAARSTPLCWPGGRWGAGRSG